MLLTEEAGQEIRRREMRRSRRRVGSASDLICVFIRDRRIPSDEPKQPVGFALATSSQLELLAGLRRLRPEIGDRYEGCLRVLSDGQNPDRLGQAALSIREIVDGLHLIVEVPRQP